MSEPTTTAGVTLERIVRNAMPAADGVRDFILRIEAEARAAALDEARAAVRDLGDALDEARAAVRDLGDALVNPYTDATISVARGEAIGLAGAERAEATGYARGVAAALDDETLGDALHSTYHPVHPWSGCYNPEIVYGVWLPRFRAAIDALREVADKT